MKKERERYGSLRNKAEDLQRALARAGPHPIGQSPKPELLPCRLRQLGFDPKMSCDTTTHFTIDACAWTPLTSVFKPGVNASVNRVSKASWS